MSKTLTSTPPIYHIQKTYLENADKGPFFNEPVPEREWPPTDQWIDFFGIPVASPIGVPAGPLLNSKWTTLAARLGYDILTYKTIRSYEHPAHPLPNVLIIETEGELTRDRLGGVVKPRDSEPETANELAITNSFGNPSRSNDYLQKDIHLAIHALEEGQVLIVSVFGTGDTLQELKQDFVKAALLAKDAGAQVIEVNFSCPNVAAGGSLYQDADSSYALSKAVVDAVGDTPVIVKMGIFPSRDLMEKVLIALARAGMRAVCGINTVPMKVIDENGEPSLGENRVVSGICGGPVRSLALEFVHDARHVIKDHGLDLEVLGCGGITEPQHFDLFLRMGAKAALTATGMMWNPYIAHQWHQHKKKET